MGLVAHGLTWRTNPQWHGASCRLRSVPIASLSLPSPKGDELRREHDSEGRRRSQVRVRKPIGGSARRVSGSGRGPCDEVTITTVAMGPNEPERR